MDFVRHSPAREIAARLMGLDEVRFFYDQLFVKEPGTRMPTGVAPRPAVLAAGGEPRGLGVARPDAGDAGDQRAGLCRRLARMGRHVPPGPRGAARGLRARRGRRVSRLPDVPQGVRQPRLPLPLLGHGGGRLHRPPPAGGARGGRQPVGCGAQGGAVVPVLRRRHHLARPPAPNSTSPAPRRRISRSASCPTTTTCSPWCGGRGQGRAYPASASSTLGRYSAPRASIRLR